MKDSSSPTPLLAGREVLKEASLHVYTSWAVAFDRLEAEQRLVDTVGDWANWVQGLLGAWWQWLNKEGRELAVPSWSGNGETGLVELFRLPAAEREWLPGQNGEAGFVVVRQLQDSLIFHLASGQEGAAGKEIWQRLRQGVGQGVAVPSPPAETKKFFLGQLLCFAGRVQDEQMGKVEAGRALLGEGGLRRVSLGEGMWLWDRVGLADQVALFYLDGEEWEEQAAVILNEPLPLFSLYLHKIHYQYHQVYKADLQAALAGEEKKLRGILDGVQVANFDQLEQGLQQLAKGYGQFGRLLGKMERGRQSVQVNVGNLHRELQKWALPSSGVVGAWLEVGQRAAEQLETDEQFYRATLREVEVGMRTVGTQVEILRGREESRENHTNEQRNLILAFVGLMLALGEFIDGDLAYELVCMVVTGFGRVCDGQGEMATVWLFLVRLALAVTISGVVWGGWQWWQRKRGRGVKQA